VRGRKSLVLLLAALAWMACARPAAAAYSHLVCRNLSGTRGCSTPRVDHGGLTPGDSLMWDLDDRFSGVDETDPLLGNSTAFAIANGSGLACLTYDFNAHNWAWNPCNASAAQGNQIIQGQSGASVQDWAITNGILRFSGTSSAWNYLSDPGTTDGTVGQNIVLGLGGDHTTTGYGNTLAGYNVANSAATGAGLYRNVFMGLSSGTTVGSGSGATGSCTVSAGALTGCSVSAGGSGYNSPPRVTADEAGCTDALLDATVSGGAVTAINVDSAGSSCPGSSITPVIHGTEDNVCIGALTCRGTGAYPIQSVFIGLDSGRFVTNGYGNTGVGYESLGLVTSGIFNVAIGHKAGHAITTATSNVLIGRAAGTAITSGNYNVGVGHAALFVATTGTFNAALGDEALENVTTGSYNIGIGVQAQPSSATAVERVAIGYLASPGCDNCTVIGTDSGTSAHMQKVGIGISSPTERLHIDGGLRLDATPSQPTCDSGHRGLIWGTKSATGVKDTLNFCGKDASDVYAWRSIY
jgi:hypothetical protein